MASVTHLLYTNKVKTIVPTIYHSSEDANYPTENLYNDNIAKPFRTYVTGNNHLILDFGAATAIDTVVLVNVNFTTSATVKVQGNSTLNFTSPTVDETATVSHLNAVKQNIYVEFTSSSQRYWKITFNDSTVTDSYLEIGELWMGVRVELEDGVAINQQMNRIRSALVNKTDRGQTWVYNRGVYHELGLTFPSIQTTTRDQLDALEIATEGARYPFVIILDKNDSGECFFVRMLNGWSESKLHYNVWTLSMTLTEEEVGTSVDYGSGSTPTNYIYGYPTGVGSTPETGVAAQWIFDEASGNIVDEVNSITLIPNSGGGYPVYSVASTGIYADISPGITIDASRYFEKTGTEANLDVSTSDMVFEMWFKDNGSTNNGYLLDTRDPSTGQGYCFGFSPGAERLFINFKADDGTTVSTNTGGGALFNTSTLMKFRFACEAGVEIIAYVDGIPQTSMNITALSGKSLSANQVTIGADYAHALLGTVGTMYEARVTIGNSTNNSGGNGGG